MPKLVISEPGGEREVALTNDITSIGRVAQVNDVVIDVAEASRQHCKIHREGNSWSVEDLGSRNGTRVNGRKVTKFELQDGDEIQVGVITLKFFESDALGGPVMDAAPELELEISLEEDAFLRFLGGDRENEKVVLSARTTFGNKSTNTIVLKDKGVSGSHCEVVNRDGVWIARDLGSTNGTLVDGEKIVECRLSPGQVLKVGIVEFVFGVGQNEGSGSLVRTVALETVEMDDAVFAISDRNLGRKEKTQFVLWMAFFAVILGSAAAWFALGSSQEEASVEVLTVTGNLLTQGTSFEVNDDLGDYLLTESDSIDYEETTAQRHSGRYSLQLTARGVAGSHAVYLATTLNNLSASDQLEISGWFRTAGLTQGTCGLVLQWLRENDSTLGYSYLNAPAALGSFAQVSGVFKVPFGVAKARFGIAAHGAQGKFLVDDVAALRRLGENRTSIVAHEYEIMLDKSGEASLSRNSEEILRHAGFYWVEANTVRPVAPYARVASFIRENNSVTLSGDAADSTSGGGGALECRLVTGPVGAEISASLSSSDANLRFGVVVDPDEGLATVIGGKAQRRAEPFEAADVASLVVSTAHRAVRFNFPASTSVAMVKHRDEYILLFPAVEIDGRRTFACTWQVNFSAENKEIEAADQMAGRAEMVDRSFGKAMSLYQEIIDRYPFRRDLVERAAARLENLRREGISLAERLEKRRSETEFFGTYEANYDAVRQEAEAAALAYAGSELSSRFQALADELKASYDRVLGERRLELARNHLTRGQDLVSGKRVRPALAQGFFRSVIDLVPDSDLAAQAAAELERIKNLMGVK